MYHKIHFLVFVLRYLERGGRSSLRPGPFYSTRQGGAPLRCAGPPTRRVQFESDVVESGVAEELQSVSLDDGPPLVTAPVAEQQVGLEDAVTYYSRASSRRPPVERHR